MEAEDLKADSRTAHTPKFKDLYGSVRLGPCMTTMEQAADPYWACSRNESWIFLL